MPGGRALSSPTPRITSFARSISRRGIITTVLGTGQRGDGPETDPLQCKLARPHGVCVDRRRACCTSPTARRTASASCNIMSTRTPLPPHSSWNGPAATSAREYRTKLRVAVEALPGDKLWSRPTTSQQRRQPAAAPRGQHPPVDRQRRRRRAEYPGSRSASSRRAKGSPRRNCSPRSIGRWMRSTRARHADRADLRDVGRSRAAT